MIFDITDCEERLGYEFDDKNLLRKCFTHASYANENHTDDNEILEFFGDAVIQFIVTEYLFKNAYAEEGELTKKRMALVSKQPLQKAVEALRLGEFLLLGKGQEQNKTLDEKMYSSLYEAVCAGIYLDGGMASAKKFITETLINPNLKPAVKSELRKTVKVEQKVKKENLDGKSALQEYVQKYKLGSIAYELLSKKGPDHSPIFRVALTLNGRNLSEGVGQSKKAAETECARKALQKLQKQAGKR